MNADPHSYTTTSNDAKLASPTVPNSPASATTKTHTVSNSDAAASATEGSIKTADHQTSNNKPYDANHKEKTINILPNYKKVKKLFQPPSSSPPPPVAHSNKNLPPVKDSDTNSLNLPSNTHTKDDVTYSNDIDSQRQMNKNDGDKEEEEGRSTNKLDLNEKPAIVDASESISDGGARGDVDNHNIYSSLEADLPSGVLSGTVEGNTFNKEPRHQLVGTDELASNLEAGDTDDKGDNTKR